MGFHCFSAGAQDVLCYVIVMSDMKVIKPPEVPCKNVLMLHTSSIDTLCWKLQPASRWALGFN